jgi:hypothetical protein
VQPTSPSTPRSELLGSGDGRSPALLSGLVSSSETKGTATRVYRGEKRIARLRKAVPVAAQQITCEVNGRGGGFRYSIAMVTLTYRPGSEWGPDDINEFQRHLVGYLARRGIRYRAVWVGELQKRGALHYHIVLWLPRGRAMPKPDKQGWWPHGSTRVEWARNPVGYLVKYTSKANHSAQFPKGCRLFGVRGLTGGHRRGYRLLMQPFWVSEAMGHHNLCKRLKGGWWVSEDGVLFQSPWMIVTRASDWSWIEFGPRSDDLVKVVRGPQPSREAWLSSERAEVTTVALG